MWNLLRFTYRHHHQFQRLYSIRPIQPDRTRDFNFALALGAALGLVTANVVVLAEKQEQPETSSIPTATTDRSDLKQPSRKSYKYVICGGGVAAQEALKVFIEEKQSSDVLVVTPEWRTHPFYPSSSFSNNTHKPPVLQGHDDEQRPASNPFWNIFPFSSSSSPSAAHSERCEADVVIGRKVTAIDTNKRKIILDGDVENEVSFEKLLVAVGVTSPTLPVGRVISTDAFNKGLAGDVNNWDALMRKIQNHSSSPSSSPLHITIVGSGNWFATVVGMKLIQLGCSITFIHSDPCFLARCLPKYAANDIKDRLYWSADQISRFHNIDLLAYSVVRFIIARPSLSPPLVNNTQAAAVISTDSSPEITSSEANRLRHSPQRNSAVSSNNLTTGQQQTVQPFEAEVHVSSVFDAFSLIDFRTDHILFIPTTNTTCPADLQINDITRIEDRDTILTNKQLSAASDIYVAGSANGANEWSEEYARQTGRKAAQNMLGAREGWDWEDGVRVSEVDLKDIDLNIKLIGDVDGSMESFGYFEDGKKLRHHKNRNGNEEEDEEPANMSGGRLKKGVVFCVEGVKPRFRGDGLRMVIKGIALWNGSLPENEAFEHDAELIRKARQIVKSEPMVRSKLEQTMDDFVCEEIHISQFESDEDENSDDDSSGNRDEGHRSMKRPAIGVVWRKHLSKRKVPLRSDEPMWVHNDWVGAASPMGTADEKTRAYEELLRKSAENGRSGRDAFAR